MNGDSFGGFFVGIILVLIIIFSFKIAAEKNETLKKSYNDIFGIN